MKKAEAELKNSPFNLGIIGFGNIGRVHFDALTKSGQSDFKIKAISDFNPGSFDNVHFYENYRDLLNEPAIQAVSINTPPNTHHQLVMDALEAGKHVLVEKPPALTVAQCDQMINFAVQKEKVLFMAFHARYNPAVAAASSELKGKNVKNIDIQYAEYALTYHSPDGWIFDPEVAGGGVLMDSGINALSIVTSVLPDLHALSVREAQFRKANGFRVETEADITLSFGDKGTGTIAMDWMHQGPEVRKITFGTDQGQYSVDIVKNIFSKNGNMLVGVDATREAVDQESEYRGLYRDFARHLVLGDSLTSTKELAFIKEAYRKAGLYSFK